MAISGFQRLYASTTSTANKATTLATSWARNGLGDAEANSLIFDKSLPPVVKRQNAQMMGAVGEKRCAYTKAASGLQRGNRNALALIALLVASPALTSIKLPNAMSKHFDLKTDRHSLLMANLSYFKKGVGKTILFWGAHIHHLLSL